MSLAKPMSKGLDVARLAVLLGGEEAKGEVWSLKLGLLAVSSSFEL